MVKVEVPLLLLLVAPRLCECKLLCVCLCVCHQGEKKKNIRQTPGAAVVPSVCPMFHTDTHRYAELYPACSYVRATFFTNLLLFLLCVSQLLLGLRNLERKPESQRSVLPTEDQKAHQLCFRLRTYKPKYVSSFKCWILEPQHLHTAPCINSKPSPHLLSALIRPALTLHYSSLEILQGTTVLKYAFWRTSATSDASTRCPLPHYKSFLHLLSLAPL